MLIANYSIFDFFVVAWHNASMGEMAVQVGRYKRKDGTWVRGYTKIVPTADHSLQKVSKSRGGVQGLASREPEAEDVIFALDPETSPWSQVGFTHDSNWLVWHLSGYSPKDTARKQKAGCQPGLLEYGKLYEYVEDNPHFDWKDFPVQHLTDISYLFETWQFNEPIEHFDVSNIVNMRSLFEENEIFNQPLNGWDVSNVKNMRAMFSGAVEFNQPLNSWDVSNVEDMCNMFCAAYNFDQNLGAWDISNAPDMEDMFFLSGMSAKNLSLTFQGWAARLAETKNGSKTIELGKLPETVDKMDKKGKVALKHLQFGRQVR
jgi:hypothetical protein